MTTGLQKLELERKLRCTKAQGLQQPGVGSWESSKREMFPELSGGVCRAKGYPRGQSTAWNLLKYYRNRELHVEKPGRIGKILLGGTGVASFSLPGSALPPDLGFNLLGEPDGNGSPAPSQLPVNAPCWKHCPAAKG